MPLPRGFSLAKDDDFLRGHRFCVVLPSQRRVWSQVSCVSLTCPVGLRSWAWSPDGLAVVVWDSILFMVPENHRGWFLMQITNELQMDNLNHASFVFIARWVDFKIQSSRPPGKKHIEPSGKISPKRSSTRAREVTSLTHTRTIDTWERPVTQSAKLKQKKFHTEVLCTEGWSQESH